MAPTKKVIKKKNATSPKNIKQLMAVFNPRIDKGVRYLDKKLGRLVWLEKIDETKLDVSRSTVCVCGQLFDDFWDHIMAEAGHPGMERSELTDEETQKILKKHSIPFGFSIEDSIEAEFDYAWDVLTRLWFIKISILRLEAELGVKKPPPF